MREIEARALARKAAIAFADDMERLGIEISESDIESLAEQMYETIMRSV